MTVAARPTDGYAPRLDSLLLGRNRDTAVPESPESVREDSEAFRLKHRRFQWSGINEASDLPDDRETRGLAAFSAASCSG